MTISESTGTPITLGLEIEPDWGADVYAFELFTANQSFRTRAGREQRVNFREKPRRGIRYEVAACRLTAFRDHISVLGTWAKTPLFVPWWTDGLRLGITMATVNSLQFEIPPGTCHQIKAGSSLLVGSTLRTIASITGNAATLDALGGSTQAAAGTWVYPYRLAFMRDASGALSRARRDATGQQLQFDEI